ncbi:hypothetical protein BDW22DRAFT_417450 [Trametopsis cervina]|nr:hypothetical protein BDW22DRAFT_417450 [Trametopsis cervina]
MDADGRGYSLSPPVRVCIELRRVALAFGPSAGARGVPFPFVSFSCVRRMSGNARYSIQEHRLQCTIQTNTAGDVCTGQGWRGRARGAGIFCGTQRQRQRCRWTLDAARIAHIAHRPSPSPASHSPHSTRGQTEGDEGVHSTHAHAFTPPGAGLQPARWEAEEDGEQGGGRGDGREGNWTGLGWDRMGQDRIGWWG